jgi:hypothetical protein
LSILVLSFFLFSSLSAKRKQKSIASIPFDMVGTYVVLKVHVNDSPSLNLILDSGIRNTLITELLPGDNISLNYASVKELMGLGGGNQLEAYTSNVNILKIGKIKLENKTVLVLKKDVFNLSKQTGTRINGLIGIDLFQDYIVDIDYTSKRIRFYEKSTSFLPPLGYDSIPLSIEGQKMFVDLFVLEADSTRRKVKMLIDTGAELNAWFQTFKKESVHIPEKGVRGTIGQGLNGEITGKLGRIPQICFGNHCFANPIVSFVDSASIAQIVANSDRDGTVGAQILSRFNYIIDYTQKKFYFKPNFYFKKNFAYNIAGIDLTQIIPLVPQTEVLYVWENSPAALAGVKVGDQLLEVNGNRAFQMTINELKMIFETPSKKPLTLILLRGDKEISVEIDMNGKI